MLEFLIASSINCQQAEGIIARVKISKDLDDQVKAEIVTELQKASDCNWDAYVD
jgi:hypothetical protein